MKRAKKEKFGSEEIYKYYVKNTAYKRRYVNKMVFRSFLKGVFRDIIVILVKDGIRFFPVYGLGSIVMSKRKQKVYINDEGKISRQGYMIDWKRTKEMWERSPEKKEQKKFVYYDNPELKGYLAKVSWYKPLPHMNKYRWYRFRFTRQNRKFLSSILKAFPESINNYFDLSKMKGIKNA